MVIESHRKPKLEDNPSVIDPLKIIKEDFGGFLARLKSSFGLSVKPQDIVKFLKNKGFKNNEADSLAYHIYQIFTLTFMNVLDYNRIQSKLASRLNEPYESIHAYFEDDENEIDFDHRFKKEVTKKYAPRWLIDYAIKCARLEFSQNDLESLRIQNLNFYYDNVELYPLAQEFLKRLKIKAIDDVEE